MNRQDAKDAKFGTFIGFPWRTWHLGGVKLFILKPVMSLKVYLAARAAEVDAAMDAFLPKAKERPATIHAAMRYAVFAGGKRLRPVLCLAAAEACGGALANAIAAACALELMHTYSLVHDDLPAMDDDDLRRGRPTCHKVYGEGMAVLCGDALLTEAFIVLAQTPATKRYGTRDYITELAATGGSKKLIGGQVMDLEGEGKKLTRRELVRIHEAKTAALLTTSLRLGAMTANATPAKLLALTEFGHALGLAFQVIDDILDCHPKHGSVRQNRGQGPGRREIHLSGGARVGGVAQGSGETHRGGDGGPQAVRQAGVAPRGNRGLPAAARVLKAGTLRRIRSAGRRGRKGWRSRRAGRWSPRTRGEIRRRGRRRFPPRRNRLRGRLTGWRRWCRGGRCKTSRSGRAPGASEAMSCRPGAAVWAASQRSKGRGSAMCGQRVLAALFARFQRVAPPLVGFAVAGMHHGVAGD